MASLRQKKAATYSYISPQSKPKVSRPSKKDKTWSLKSLKARVDRKQLT
ncbi:hypothetical protein E6C60_3849 [Paenibacillus algicola]|uniref:Uncharacterized protein n=1 Tax=Paenibacillus algicola TaxID=2565926 RepID=A0A4V1G4F9_9BACL|nr:hypothetical protein E6C60_3849 [Paenibacillus algicola]